MAQTEADRVAARPAVRLICHDERLARGLCLFLADLGLEVVPAEGGRPPALILLDADDPVVPDLPAGVPVVAFACRETATALGGHRFAALLRRPVSLDELEAVVLRILGALPSVGCHPASDVQARASESAAVFTAVPDGAAGWLRSGGQTIRLTPTEWALFACLREADGEPVSRETLAALVGNGKPPVSCHPERSVDVYICYLRRKLAHLPGSGQVLTVRGHGYRLVP